MIPFGLLFATFLPTWRTLTFGRSLCSENYPYSVRSTTTPDFTQQSPSTLLHLQLNSHLVLPSSWYKTQVNPNLRVQISNLAWYNIYLMLTSRVVTKKRAAEATQELRRRVRTR